MRPITTDGGEPSAPPALPCAGSPAFVAGMGHRMAVAALRPRQAAAPDRAEVPPRRPVDPALARLVAPRPSPASPQRPGLARICQVAGLCGTAAAGAALLYWQKSGGGAENREIGRVQQAVQQAHARTALLRTEWTALNESGRLQDLADRTLVLRPIAPEQFVAPGQLHAWLQAPASLPPVPPPPAPPTQATDPAAEPGLPDAPVAVAAVARPVPRPRLVALALPPPPPAPPPQRPQRTPPVALAALPEAYPAFRPARAAAPPRYELPRWLTQAQPRRPTILVMSEPPHALALPLAPRPVAAPTDPWPAPARSFAMVAASPGEPSYDGPAAGWQPGEVPGAWPYARAALPPYGWRPPY